VTGGAGFIGSHLAAALLAAGQEVRILDNLATGKQANLPEGAAFIKGDIRDRDTVRRAMEGIETVYHLAALVSVPRSVKDPLETNDVNVGGTFAVLTEAAAGGARRLVFAGSSSVYGDKGELPRHEGQVPDPLSPYAVSKAAGEIACRSFTSACGLETVCLRFFNVYGPRQDPDSPYAAVIPIFLTKLLAGEELPVFGDGRQTRDFTYVDDVVRGIIAAAGAEGAAGEILNIAGGHPVSLLELAEAAGRVTGIEARPRFLPPRAGDVRHSYGDGSRAERTLGFRPEIGIEEGLRRTAGAFRRA
jgi:UDP-glucose 4-epimerase